MIQNQDDSLIEEGLYRNAVHVVGWRWTQGMCEDNIDKKIKADV